MFNFPVFSALLIFLMYYVFFVENCLITNCPRGGKRSGRMLQMDVKPCVSCGPGRSGQCFGPGICCGRFGCLVGTHETQRCQKDGYFHDPEPCIAGNSSCRRNTGRCAADGICCNQDSCHMDPGCFFEEKTGSKSFNGGDNIFPMDIYNLLTYQNDDVVKK